MPNLQEIAFDWRLDILELVHNAGCGHIGGCMSAIDPLVCLYYGVMDTDKIKAGAADRDRFILSKGHCAQALYSCLADLDFFPRAELGTYAAFGTRLAEHPTHSIPGVEVATGALGHGMSVGVGMAIQLKRQAPAARVYVLTGDGEQAEGSNWEAAMSAAKFGLDNYTVLIDRNRLQISGGTEEVMPLDDLAAKYRAFGFAVDECRGADHAAVCAALRARSERGRPRCLILDTVKGAGSPVMENKADWHHRVPTEAEYQQIKKDLLAGKERAKNG